jgi:hypothetical protein
MINSGLHMVRNDIQNHQHDRKNLQEKIIEIRIEQYDDRILQSQ